MKTITKITLIFIFIFQSTVFGQGHTPELLSNKYDDLLREQNRGVGLLIKKNNTVHTLSLGAHELTANSVFNIGSATKTFTAILILQELEKGTIKLHDTIGSYISGIPNVDGHLSIQSLLTHESGLDEVIGKNILDIYFAKSDTVYNQNLLLQLEKSDAKSKGQFNYCNTNYLLLGKIMEKISDQRYFDLVRERIFEPLKMRNTYAYVHKNIPNLATPMHDGKDVTAYIDHRYYGGVAFSAGSIASTLFDMEVFYTALFETEKLLKKETVKLMMDTGNKEYGLGLFKSEHNGEIYVSHGGNNIGYSFGNRYNPVTKELFLIFSNERTIPLNKSITKDLISYLNDDEIISFEDLDLEKFKSYVGTYLLKEADLKLKIALENNKMYLIAESQGIKSELAQKDNNSIFDTTVGATMTIIEGDTNRLAFSQNGFETIIHKIETK